nr:uncharacterized protein LOC121126794 [Lepeophtheirus salmonis]
MTRSILTFSIIFLQCQTFNLLNVVDFNLLQTYSSTDDFEKSVEKIDINSTINGEKLFCYSCTTIKDGSNCRNLNHSNNSLRTRICVGKKVFCKVRRMEYHISDEYDHSAGAIQWSMERDCAYESCQNFCVSMGARTRFTYCTSCCDTNYCNIDSGSWYNLPNFFQNFMHGLITYKIIL